MDDNERFKKLAEPARRVLSLALEEAQRLNQNYIGTEHVLVGLLLEGDGVAARVLHVCGVELSRVRGAVDQITGQSDRSVLGEIGLTPHATNVIDLAVEEANLLNSPSVDTEHLLLGLTREEAGVAAGVLQGLGVNLEELRNQTFQLITRRGDSITTDSRDLDNPVDPPQTPYRTPTFDQMGTDLTAQERQGTLDSYSDDAREIERVIQILSRRRKTNVALIGETGIGTMAIVAGLANCILAGEVPEALLGKRVLTLDAGSLIAGTMSRGDAMKRLQKNIDELRSYQNCIFFIDEIQTVLGAHAGDAASIFKLALSRSGLHCIVATTLDAYRTFIQSDEGLRRAFRPVIVHAAREDQTILNQSSGYSVTGTAGESDKGLFETFTEQARAVLRLAKEEARRFNHNYVGTEHLLLGLVRKGDGAAVEVLSNLGVERSKVQSAVEFIIRRDDWIVVGDHVGNGDRVAGGNAGLTPRARKVIELAVDEARCLHRDRVGTAHLLLGLIGEGEGIAAGVLQSLGVDLVKARTQTIQVLRPIGAAPEPELRVEHDNDRFDKFSERARKVLSIAQEEAGRFNHNYIGTEHLLLGLVREGDGVAAKVLSNLGVELNKVRSAVEFIIGRGDRIVLGDIGLTPRSKTVIQLAVDEARRLNHNYIGTEHLLLGLVREGQGIGAGVLESLGANLEKVRAETIQVLNQTSSNPPVQRGWGLPTLGTERLAYIEVEMQNTFHIGDHDENESLAAAQGRAYSLARSTSELLTEVARLQEHVRILRQSQG